MMLCLSKITNRASFIPQRIWFEHNPSSRCESKQKRVSLCQLSLLCFGHFYKVGVIVMVSPCISGLKLDTKRLSVETYIELTKPIIIMQGGLSMAYIITFTLCPLKAANQWKI